MHLRRYNIKPFWKLPKKEQKYTVTPRPGPHEKDNCIPLLVVARNVLQLARTGSEANKIIKSGGIIVDKKPRKDPNYPVGLMDTIDIPGIKKHFRVMVDKHGLLLEKAEEGDTEKKLLRIEGKKKIHGNRIQLNLHDGRNIIVEKDVYKTNDSIIVKLPEQKILKHFKYEKGTPAMIISGRNLGLHGKIKSVQNRKTMLETSRVVLETKAGDIETVREYVLVGEI